MQQNLEKQQQTLEKQQQTLAKQQQMLDKFDVVIQQVQQHQVAITNLKQEVGELHQKIEKLQIERGPGSSAMSGHVARVAIQLEQEKLSSNAVFVGPKELELQTKEQAARQLEIDAAEIVSVTPLPMRDGTEQRVLIRCTNKSAAERLIGKKQGGGRFMKDKGPMQRREGFLLGSLQKVVSDRYQFVFARGRARVVDHGGGRPVWAPYDLWQHADTLDTQRRLVLQHADRDDVLARVLQALESRGEPVPDGAWIPPRPEGSRGRDRDASNSGFTPAAQRRRSYTHVVSPR